MQASESAMFYRIGLRNKLPVFTLCAMQNTITGKILSLYKKLF